MINGTTATQTVPAGFWDERYSSYVTVYGDEPNAFFKEAIDRLAAGKLLLPGEGEGRNAIYAAKRGWHVDAFDFSESARVKALQRAAENDVTINYVTGDIEDIIIPVDTYEAVALIYLHLEEEARNKLHALAARSLKVGGHLILEAFSKDQVKNISGGPRDKRLLYDLEDLKSDFKDLHITLAKHETIRLNEGPFHQGKADVVRLIATKPG